MRALRASPAAKLRTAPSPELRARPPQKAQAQWEAPPSQKGNNLNLIVLVSDSFRADNLAAYGSTWVDTPNLNDFAKESIVFDSYYPEGLPTIPLRRQLYTGGAFFPPTFTSSRTRSSCRAGMSCLSRTSHLPRRCWRRATRRRSSRICLTSSSRGAIFSGASTTSSGYVVKRSITTRKRRAQPRTSVLYIPWTTCN